MSSGSWVNTRVLLLRSSTNPPETQTESPDSSFNPELEALNLPLLSAGSHRSRSSIVMMVAVVVVVVVAVLVVEAVVKEEAKLEAEVVWRIFRR